MSDTLWCKLNELYKPSFMLWMTQISLTALAEKQRRGTTLLTIWWCRISFFKFLFTSFIADILGAQLAPSSFTIFYSSSFYLAWSIRLVPNQSSNMWISSSVCWLFRITFLSSRLEFYWWIWTRIPHIGTKLTSFHALEAYHTSSATEIACNRQWVNVHVSRHAFFNNCFINLWE